MKLFLSSLLYAPPYRMLLLLLLLVIPFGQTSNIIIHSYPIVVPLSPIPISIPSSSSSSSSSSSTGSRHHVHRTDSNYCFGLRNNYGNQPLLLLSSSRRRRQRHFALSLSSGIEQQQQQHQLSPHTFAGMVERQLMKKFPMTVTTKTNNNNNNGKNSAVPVLLSNNSIERVLQSWRLLDQDYIHHFHYNDNTTTSTSNDDSLNNNNNNSSSSNVMSYQLCHSYVPGLTVREYWDTQPYEWCDQLKSKFILIRDEFVSVISDREHMNKYGNNIWAKAASDSEMAQQYGDGWSTLVLMNRGIWDEQNVQLFPKTSQAIYDCNIPAVEIFFASMQPNTTIPYHSDYTNFVLTCHLGIDIPNNGQNQCRLCVGGMNEQQWLNGEIMIFDTSIMHNAVNECTDQVRYILMMRIWHPELTYMERQALQYIYDILEFPELLTTTTTIEQQDEERLQIVEEQIQQAKTFPLLLLRSIQPTTTTTTTSITNSNKLKSTRTTTNKNTGNGFGTTTTTNSVTTTAGVSSKKKKK